MNSLITNFLSLLVFLAAFAFFDHLIDERNKAQLEVAGLREAARISGEMLADRDENDRTRAVAPLVPAPDAVEIDTTGNTLEQSFAFLYKTIKERLAQ